jgi:choline kinase
MRASILTAGASPRLRPLTDATARTLLPVAGLPILRRTIANLVSAGFDELVIGTGYRAEMVRAAVAEWFPDLDVTYVDNPDYETTHNGHSLSLLRPHLDGRPFLLLDDDVVFDPGVLDLLLGHGLDSIAVRSVGGIHPDEVKVHADDQDRVQQIGPDAALRGAMGESIGIALLSADTSKRLFAALETRTGSPYETAFQHIIDEGATLFAVDIGTLYALGIDTHDDLRAANERLASRPAFDADAAHRLAI